MPLKIQRIPLGMHRLRQNKAPETLKSLLGLHSLANIDIVISFFKIKSKQQQQVVDVTLQI